MAKTPPITPIEPITQGTDPLRFTLDTTTDATEQGKTPTKTLKDGSVTRFNRNRGQVHQQSTHWLTVALWAALVLGVFWVFVGGGSVPVPIPDDGRVDVDGFNVLVVKPEDTSNLTPGQVEVLNSAELADWVTNNGGEFRAYEESVDLSTLTEQLWKEMRVHSSGDNKFVVVGNKRLYLSAIPDGVDAAIEYLEGKQ